MENEPNIIALGLMSGTSLDAIDLAVISSDGQSEVEPLAFEITPLSSGLRADIRKMISRAQSGAIDWAHDPEVAHLTAHVTEAHILATSRFLDKHQFSVSLIGFHGQTVWHDPDNGITVQLGDGQGMADALGIQVVDQFRIADVAAGGQGAPLVPIYHAALCDELSGPIAILNIGGVSNVTYVGERLNGQPQLLAFDTGPGNALINDWMKEHLDLEHDPNGAYAQKGNVSYPIVQTLMADPYFNLSPPKSLDRNRFVPKLLMAGLSVEDGAATLTSFSVSAVIAAQAYFPKPVQRWIICGGGRYNNTIMSGLSEALDGEVVACDTLGWQGDAIEAQAFAYLAIRTVRGLVTSIPETTGAKYDVQGGRLSKPRL